jgi:diguanylate cyclase (GGDEF)-like protein
LISVALALGAGMRKNDLLARIGGDEFAVVLPQTTAAEADEIAERLRHAIEGTERLPEGARSTLTASFGVAVKQNSTDSWDELIMRCDRALYSVKRVGGNLVQRDLDWPSGLFTV